MPTVHQGKAASNRSIITPAVTVTKPQYSYDEPEGKRVTDPDPLPAILSSDNAHDIPTVALLVRTFHKGREEIERFLFTSIRLFWPASWKIQLVFVLDDESAEDHKLGEALQREILPQLLQASGDKAGVFV